MLSFRNVLRFRVPSVVVKNDFKNVPALCSVRKSYLSTERPQEKSTGVIDRLFGLESCEAAPTFRNRWAMAVPAFLTHMSIGIA